MIYLDTSIALAQLLAEDRMPPVQLWEETLITSRLLVYEIWTRLHGRGLARSHGDLAQNLLDRLALVELAPDILARALEPFPSPVRTLDALHLATLDFLRKKNQEVQLASYDERMVTCALLLAIPVYDTFQ
jgi:predicted nucleic acid-binding protein